MRALKIDPNTREISEIDISRRDINVNNNTRLIYIDKEIALLYSIDESGNNSFGFIGMEDRIYSPAIVIGIKNNKLKPLQENLSSFEMMTEWF